MKDLTIAKLSWQLFKQEKEKAEEWEEKHLHTILVLSNELEHYKRLKISFEEFETSYLSRLEQS